MQNEAVQKYRLMIGTPRSGTLICIGAVKDDDAVRKAEAIVAQLGVPLSSLRLMRANGSTLTVRYEHRVA